MGRVSKYKRLKKCDPFSRHFNYQGSHHKSKGREPRANELADPDDAVFQAFTQPLSKPAPKKKSKGKTQQPEKRSKAKEGVKYAKQGGKDASVARKKGKVAPPLGDLSKKVPLRLSWMGPKTAGPVKPRMSAEYYEAEREQRKRDLEEGVVTADGEGDEEQQAAAAAPKLKTTVILKPRKRDDETMTQYRRRVDRELRETLKQQTSRAPSKTALKRKQWQQERASKKRKRAGSGEEGDDEVAAKQTEFASDHVRFGEVAMAPPSLPLPKKGRTKQNMRSALFNQYVEQETSAGAASVGRTEDPAITAATAATAAFSASLVKTKLIGTSGGGRNKASKVGAEFRNLSMADLAQRARDQYALMKKNRRNQ